MAMFNGVYSFAAVYLGLGQITRPLPVVSAFCVNSGKDLGYGSQDRVIKHLSLSRFQSMYSYCAVSIVQDSTIVLNVAILFGFIWDSVSCIMEKKSSENQVTSCGAPSKWSTFSGAGFCCLGKNYVQPPVTKLWSLKHAQKVGYIIVWFYHTTLSVTKLKKYNQEYICK